MIIEFNVYDWRDIMRVCGPTLGTDPNKEMLSYINVKCNNNWFSAYGCSGYQVARVSVRCIMDAKLLDVSFICKPQKIPVGAARVQVLHDGLPNKYTILYRDKKGCSLSAVQIEAPDGEMVDAEKIINSSLKNLDAYNYGEGKYMICVNPKYLMNALQGLKDCDAVIMNFGSRVQPFLIRPRDNSEKDVIELVLPIRI